MMRLFSTLTILLCLAGTSPLAAQELSAAETALAAGRTEEAFTTYQQLAGLANPQAQYRLGQLYAAGLGTAKDPEAAANWYRKAAEQGHADAQFALALALATGDGIAQDEDAAIDWYLRAAKQGNVDAQYNLGYMYANGLGTERDATRAKLWYRMAADEGHPRAQINLGAMYASGDGVERNEVRAAEWYRKAAVQGDADAQFSIGYLHAYGRGVPRDYAEALAWYDKAAAQGHAQAKQRQALLRKRLQPLHRTLSVPRANLRSGPGTDREVLAVIGPDSEIIELQRGPEWVEVNLPGQDPGRGWLHLSLLEPVTAQRGEAEGSAPVASYPASGVGDGGAPPQALPAPPPSEEARIALPSPVENRVEETQEAMRAGLEERTGLLTRLTSISDQTATLTAQIRAMEAQRNALREQLARRTAQAQPAPAVEAARPTPSAVGPARTGTVAPPSPSPAPAATPSASPGGTLREGFLGMLDGLDGRLQGLESRLALLERGQSEQQRQWQEVRKELLEIRAGFEEQMVRQRLKTVEAQAAEVEARMALQRTAEQLDASEQRQREIGARLDEQAVDKRELQQRTIALEEERDRLRNGLGDAEQRLLSLRRQLEALGGAAPAGSAASE